VSKAGLLNRAVSGLVDLMISVVLSTLPKAGLPAALVFLLIRDGFPGGRSPGKRITGLRTRLRGGRTDVSFRESILRNLPLAAAWLLAELPVIGWILAGLVLLFEGLLVIGSTDGRRFGDELANTQVVEDG